jgi:hypothetical protein
MSDTTPNNRDTCSFSNVNISGNRLQIKNKWNKKEIPSKPCIALIEIHKNFLRDSSAIFQFGQNYIMTTKASPCWNFLP